MRRSTVLNLHPQLIFPDIIKLFSSLIKRPNKLDSFLLARLSSLVLHLWKTKSLPMKGAPEFIFAGRLEPARV
jgi:hypothetical protein